MKVVWWSTVQIVVDNIWPVALRGLFDSSSRGARKYGSVESIALFVVIHANIFKTEAAVPPLSPPEISIKEWVNVFMG